jgi:excisionase family DNA binding protein
MEVSSCTTSGIKLLTVREMCQVLGIGRNKGYELIARRLIKHIKIGGRIKIPSEYLEEFIKTVTI